LDEDQTTVARFNGNRAGCGKTFCRNTTLVKKTVRFHVIHPPWRSDNPPAAANHLTITCTMILLCAIVKQDRIREWLLNYDQWSIT
jgi:hypothetical protein